MECEDQIPIIYACLLRDDLSECPDRLPDRFHHASLSFRRVERAQSMPVSGGQRHGCAILFLLGRLAQAMRAVFAASATATTFSGRRP